MLAWALVMRRIVGCLVCGTSSARADEPWAVSITDAKKQQAQALLERGNALFLDRHFVEALAIYRDAIAVWDHPAICFNIVRCLIQLQRSVEAYESLMILHYDGVAWTRMDSGVSTTLTRVWGRTQTDVFAVGLAGTIVHFDGTSWTPVQSNTTYALRGVWAAARACSSPAMAVPCSS